MNVPIRHNEGLPPKFLRRKFIYLAIIAALGGCAFPVFHFVARRLFFGAVNDRDARTVASLVRLSASLVRAEDEWGATGLDRAVELNDVDTVRALVAAGADVDHEAPLTGMPLQSASIRGRIDIMLALLQAGADPNRQPRRKPSHGYGTALHFAVLSGTVEPVAMLLQNGADPNAPAIEHGDLAPLTVCVMNGPRSPELVDVVKTLLAAGADVNAVGTRGATALDAVRSARTRARGAEAKVLDDIEKALLAHGARRGPGTVGAAKRPAPN